MAVRKRGSKGSSKEREYIKVDSFRVLRAYEFDDGNVSFDLELNGIKLYRLLVIISAKDTDHQFIGFPSYQGKDEKLYNYFYISLSDEDSDKIIQAVYDIIDDE